MSCVVSAQVNMGSTSNKMGTVPMHKCNGAMKVQAIDGPVILRQSHIITYNERERDDEKESLLCVNQCREFGTMIDECAKHYGGSQFMIVRDSENDYVIPFEYFNGLTILPHEYPTDKDFKTLPVIDISDPKIPWNPKKVGHDEFDINKVKFEFRTNRRMRYKKGTRQTPI